MARAVAAALAVALAVLAAIVILGLAWLAAPAWCPEPNQSLWLAWDNDHPAAAPVRCFAATDGVDPLDHPPVPEPPPVPPPPDVRRSAL